MSVLGLLNRLASGENFSATRGDFIELRDAVLEMVDALEHIGRRIVIYTDEGGEMAERAREALERAGMPGPKPPADDQLLAVAGEIIRRLQEQKG